MDPINKQEIIIDLRRNTTVAFPYFTQFDTNVIDFIIKDKGIDADLSAVTNIVANFKRSDKVVITRSLTAVDNVVTYELGTEEMQTDGIAEISISFFEGEDRLSTRKMKLYIGESLGPAFEKSQGMPLLQELFVEVAESVQMLNETNADLNAEEDTRQFQESVREQQEDERQTNTSNAIDELNQVKEDNQINWLPEVSTVAARDTAYPNPVNGDTVRITGEARIDRYNGTSWITTDRYNPAAIDQVTQQLAETAKQNADYLYNIENALRKFLSIKYPTIVWWGDSISAGTGAPSGRGYLTQVEQTATWFFGKPNYATTLFYNYVDATWTKEDRGIALYRVVGTAESTPCKIIDYFGRFDVAVKCRIVYSTAPDGGEFDVKIGGAVVGTISCNGAAKDGLISAEYSVPANSADANTQIIPKGKVYLHGSIIYLEEHAKTPRFVNLVHGGTKIADYTDAEIVDNVTMITPDLFVMALGANDYTQNTPLATYEEKVRIAIEAAQPGASVLLLATGGNSSTSTDGGRYEAQKAVLKNLAKEYDCAFVDVDAYWGGYTEGNAQGYYADTIHPTEKGHTSMADLLTPILFRAVNVSEKNYYKAVYPNSFKWFEKRDIYHDKATKRVLSTADRIIAPNQSGTEVGWEAPIQPIIARSLAQFPQSPARGQVGFATDRNKVYVCTAERSADGATAAVWKDVFGDAWTMPEYTSLPSPSSFPAGTIIHYKSAGEDSKMYMVQMLADGVTRKWAVVGLTTVL
ncbi:SGNH/GDSL hydrolase family protein [Domibacillus enclensis]|uniref:Lysophospholipase L1 n=1 Tax=Domibacillus enclensis TaxID=1017273 RepID=A0A1N6WK55_9BACI|nr:SGNH/GDSL hydrolase family protein [Domibacillus enclensis]OXS77962.1 hypothetical protein B1B05_10170 [Domibacillus enclensis]SIQ90474.1 Lysophospholipase L1 [Domibacillus enclensis]